MFIEVGHSTRNKKGHQVCGDSFICHRNTTEGRLVAVLADGLGSGIKASVLSLLTSTMLARCVANDLDIRQTARTIMETLPICAVRKIGYSTFTIIDIDMQGNASCIEFDNPAIIWLRGDTLQPLQRQVEIIETADGRRMELRFSSVELSFEDRLIVCSDGVCQSGMGNDAYPLGWSQQKVEQFSRQWLKNNPRSSAQEMADTLSWTALHIDENQAKDDISAVVIYLRKPRQLLVVTGPPFNKRQDREIADLCTSFAGKKVICGGSTASIVARELNRTIAIDRSFDFTDVPPASQIEGIDLVTEGTLTLSRVSQLLEDDTLALHPTNAAAAVCALLKASDTISFVVGTRVNQAHQDPSLPVNLDIRRNTIGRICHLLESRHFKTTSARFI